MIPPVAARRFSRIKLIVAVLGAAGFAFPLLAMLWCRASPLPFAAESLGYRFILSERILHGEGANAWIWQGFLTTAMENTILAAMNHLSHFRPADLEGRIALYTYVYLALVSAGAVATVMAGAWLRTIDLAGMVLLAVAAAGPVFFTRMSGFYYFILPDYLVLNALFALVSLLLFQHWLAEAEVEKTFARQAGTVAAAGLLLGCMIANKITMLVIGAMPLVPLLLARPLRPARLLVNLLIAGGSALASFFLVLSWMYLFSASAVAAALRFWLKSLQTPGSAASIFTSDFQLYFTGYAYGILAGFFLLTLVIAAVPAWHRTRAHGIHYLVLGSILAAGLAWIYFLLKRPEGTTAFEAAVTWLTLGCMALAMVKGAGLRHFFAGAVAVAASIHAFSSFQWRHNINVLRDSVPAANSLWQLHRDVLDFAAGRKVVVIVPDNYYSYRGVEEFLLKGTADFQSWHVSSRGQAILDRYAPGMEFRSDYEGTAKLPLPPGVVAFWVDVPSMPPISAKYPYLKTLDARTDLRRKDWSLTAGSVGTVHAHLVQTSPGSP